VINEQIYQIGDAIRWQETKNRSVLSWVYFHSSDLTAVNGSRLRGANIGDPAINDLLVCDHDSFYWDDPGKRHHCPNCDMLHEGAVIEIRQGIIKNARIYESGEFDNSTNIYILDPSGLLKPMPEWTDRAMGSIYDLLSDDA